MKHPHLVEEQSCSRECSRLLNWLVQRTNTQRGKTTTTKETIMEHYCKIKDFNDILRKWAAADVTASTCCRGRRPLDMFLLQAHRSQCQNMKSQADGLGNKCAVPFMTPWLFFLLNRSKVKCQRTRFPPLPHLIPRKSFLLFTFSIGDRPWQLISVGLKLCATSPFHSPASSSLSAAPLCLHRAHVLFSFTRTWS